MKNYEKPLILESTDLSEGVFTASGMINDPSLTQGSGNGEPPQAAEITQASYSLALKNAWDGGQNYGITFTNNTDQNAPAISVIVTCIGTVISIGGNVEGVINGDGTAKVTFRNYGNGIASYGTYTDVYMSVTGEGEFSVQ